MSASTPPAPRKSPRRARRRASTAAIHDGRRLVGCRPMPSSRYLCLTKLQQRSQP
jgi:hypothetical protein